MKCKICGAVNEDYLEYCENCAAPLTPDEEPEQTAQPETTEPAAETYVEATGETPPAWGFVKAPQWPKPDFDANTVSESDIPEDYFKKFEPRPAQRPAQQAPVASDSASSYTNDVRTITIAPAYEDEQPVRPYDPYGRRRAAEPEQAAEEAPVQPRAAKPAKARAAKAKPSQEDDGYDYDDRFEAPHDTRKRNILFIAAAAILVILIAVFAVILIGTKYDGNFSKFISCTFKGDPITKAPEVAEEKDDTGEVAAYLITIYAKNNSVMRFTSGEIVNETPITHGSLVVRVPKTVWIPDEPLDSNTISVSPDIVIISASGKEAKLELTEPIVITVPSISLTMEQPAVSDFTVDNATVTVSGTVDNNTASVFVADSQIAVDESGHFTTTYTLPGEGTYSLEVKAQKNGCMTASNTYNITYGAGSSTTTPVQTTGNVSFSVNDDVKRYGTDATMTVAGTMEQGATISVSGVELAGDITQDPSAGTFSFTVNTANVGLYEVSINAVKGDAARASTVYLEHQPDKNEYMSGVHKINYERISQYPNHEQGYKIVGTVTEIIQDSPYVKARIKTSEGEIIFCYFSGVSEVAVGDGKTYELYADPYGTDDATGLPYMHAWFILKTSN